ncbi:glycosyltransferase family 39 protein [Alloyangia pacifica]|uniref:glycosyltransferase family 39 protein n=1 Tax=Alloyangia pacifica TaxID=311180 RepID=UPI001CD5C23D|nr:glycosyltransferase family 39 protein [Alloyangia pacifica]MCA0997330.1 glycosyltransferase family 39 protein [Alloyangia pacifica]
MSLEARAAPSAARSSADIRPDLFDLLASIAVVAIMAALSWWLAGAPGTNGIDDAAITRSYADNLARGFGFVYNEGGEHVEGATSLLWVLVLVIPYLFGDNPEVAILSISAALTVCAIWLSLGILRRMAGAQGTRAVGLACLTYLGLPGFFIWSIWSMMEIALWSALIMLLLNRLTVLVEAVERPEQADWALYGAAIALPLTRPEGVAVAVGLIGLALLSRPGAWRVTGLALLCALTSCALLTIARLAYFGVPFPNTYYAKVSSDRLQNVIDGAKYLASFVLGMPFAEVILVSWLLFAGAMLVAVLRGPAPGQRSGLLASATVFGMLFVYVALGGDHFALWRFYQPIMPIILLPIILGVLRMASAANAVPRGALLAAGAVSLLVWIALSDLYFRQARFDVAKEYSLSARGEAFGEMMNGFSPKPTIGVVAAGGVALTYDGELRDLMGLNWVEMAHANPIKIGFRNHASFDVDTFWKHQPDVVAQFDKTECQRKTWSAAAKSPSTGVSQLFFQRRFRELYVPVAFEGGGESCANAFAARDWLAGAEGGRVSVLEWGTPLPDVKD